jgi:hypothetical protein
MSYAEIGKWTVKILIGASFLTYLIGLATVSWYERKINKIHEKLQEEVTRIKVQPIAMPFIERQIRAEQEKVQPELDRLERKRRFLLDKLPLIRK